MAGFVIRLPLLYSVLRIQEFVYHARNRVWDGEEGFTSVESRPDYGGEAGRSPWRMLGFSVLSNLN
jgi:hypothetical protein